MGLFGANPRCSYILRILGRFSACPGGLVARLLTPILGVLVPQNADWVRPGSSFLGRSNSVMKASFCFGVKRVRAPCVTTVFWWRRFSGFDSVFYLNLLRVVFVASESLLESAQLNAKRRLVCGMICSVIQHWKFLSLQFVEITHMRDANFWWLLVKIWTSNIGVCREVAKIGIRSFHAR